jgi:integrase
MAISKRRNRQGVVTGYQVTVNAPDPRTGTTVRRVVGTYLRRKEADSAERTAKVAIQNGTFQLEAPEPPRMVTVADAVAIWFETKRQSIQPNSATGYRSAVDNHVIPALGDRDITTLTHDDVQRQVNQWRDGGMGPRLLHLCVMVLRASLSRQVKNGTIPANVAEGIEKPSARTRKEFVVWSDEQVGTFLTAAEADRIAPLWFLTLLEGMRRGEALGLRWRDLHWSNDDCTCVARISQTVVPDLANGGAALIQDRAKRVQANGRYC